MTLREVTEQSAWESFIAAQPYAQFLQSWTWGEFRGAQGCPVRRFALMEGEAWVAAIQMEYRTRRFGIGYWFAPRGPVFSSRLPSEKRRDAMMVLCEALLKQTDLRKRSLFWRFEPVSELANPEGLVPLSLQRAQALNPASTILLELTLSEEELLKRMHEKTRYNIRVAERHSVAVRIGTGAKDLDTFLALMEETAARDRFVQHPFKYLAQTYQHLASAGMAAIRVAEKEGVVLAVQMEIAYGDTVTYLYGASASASRQVMAPYALHWSAIREAKARGFSLYDFWGANPEFQGAFYYKNTWEGITRFKRGFGGRQFDLVGTWDLPFNRLVYAGIHLEQFFRG